jgi:hypothetical protein
MSTPCSGRMGISSFCLSSSQPLGATSLANGTPTSQGRGACSTLSSSLSAKLRGMAPSCDLIDLLSAAAATVRRAIRANTQTALVIVLSACMEATILIFSFYWAPWLSQIYLSSFPSVTATATAEGTISASRYLSEVNTTVSPLTEDLPGPSALLLPVSPLPLVLIYSSLMTMAMIGHYLHTLALPSYGNDHIFQGVLWVSLGGYFVAAMTSTASLSSSSLSLIYFISLAIQLCSGVYWPCVGFLRGRYILPEIRGVVISLTRCFTLFLLALNPSSPPQGAVLSSGLPPPLVPLRLPIRHLPRLLRAAPRGAVRSLDDLQTGTETPQRHESARE